MRSTTLADLRFEGVETASHPRFQTRGGVPVHRAGRFDLVELAGQFLELLLSGFNVARLQGLFVTLDLRFDHASSGSIANPCFCILASTFLGR